MMVIYLVLHATRVVNYFPRSGGIPNYSPRMIMRDEQLSMNELRLPFGTYVQVKEPSTQSNSILSRQAGLSNRKTRYYHDTTTNEYDAHDDNLHGQRLEQ
jgi:hypothetical protein